MTTNFDRRKFRIIQEIIGLNSEADLSKIEKQIESLHKKEQIEWRGAIKPIRKAVSVEDLIQEQNYHPVRHEEFFRKTKSLGIKEPLEKLLSMLD